MIDACSEIFGIFCSCFRAICRYRGRDDRNTSILANMSDNDTVTIYRHSVVCYTIPQKEIRYLLMQSHLCFWSYLNSLIFISFMSFLASSGWSVVSMLTFILSIDLMSSSLFTVQAFVLRPRCWALDTHFLLSLRML